MKATFTFDQIAHFRLLLEQKGVSPELLQEFYDSGLLAEILGVREPKKVNRTALKEVFNPPLLEPVGTVTIAATGQFVAREKFVRDTSRMAKVKIAYIGDNFTEWFLGKIEKARTETALDYARLTCSALDKDIRKEIGSEREETTLAEIYTLMERQPNGESGTLLTDGRANIFYVKDAKGILRAVHVLWPAVNGGWDVTAAPVSNLLWWVDGRRVFSRNSLVTVAA